MEKITKFVLPSNGRTYTRIENPGKYVIWGDADGNPFNNVRVFNKVVEYYDNVLAGKED